MKKNDKLSWKNISIAQYLDIQNILSNENIKPENKILEIIPVVWANIDPEIIPMAEVFDYINILNNLLNTEIKPDKVERFYMINGYGKCMVTAVDQMTLSQFMDFQIVTQNKDDKNLIDVLGCCIVPFGSKYNDGTYDLVDLKEKIAELPITAAPSIINFFVDRLGRLLKHFRVSLAKMIMQLPNMKMTQKLKMIWTTTQLTEHLDSLAQPRIIQK